MLFFVEQMRKLEEAERKRREEEEAAEAARKEAEEREGQRSQPCRIKSTHQFLIDYTLPLLSSVF